MKKETPLIVKTKEQIDLWKGIREDFLSGIQKDIVNAKLQLSFSVPDSAQYRYWSDELKSLYKQKENYGCY